MSIGASRVRKLLRLIMEKHGFANYPFEYWHFSMGDKIAAKILGKEFAIYGPVIFDPEKELMRPLAHGDIMFEIGNIIKSRS